MVRIYCCNNEFYTTREARKLLKSLRMGDKITLVKDNDKIDGEYEEDKIEGVDKI